MMRTVAIVGKGGSGKTTTAINLACSLGSMSKKVTLVDCHMTGSHLGVELGIIPSSTLNDHIVHGERLEDAMHPQFNMFVIPSALGLFGHEHAEFSGIGKSLKQTFSDFDFAVLDAAPGFGKEAVHAIKASDDVVIVVNPTTTSVADALRLKQTAVKSNKNVLGIVVNKFGNRSFELRPEEISSLVELPVLATIKEDEDFLRSQAAKTPMVFYRKNKAEEFNRLAHLVMGSEYKKRII